MHNIPLLKSEHVLREADFWFDWCSFNGSSLSAMIWMIYSTIHLLRDLLAHCVLSDAYVRSYQPFCACAVPSSLPLIHQLPHVKDISPQILDVSNKRMHNIPCFVERLRTRSWSWFPPDLMFGLNGSSAMIQSMDGLNIHLLRLVGWCSALRVLSGMAASFVHLLNRMAILVPDHHCNTTHQLLR
jgi:hypothetical protein